MKFTDTMRCLTVVTVMALALGGVAEAAPPTGPTDAAGDAFYVPPDPLPGSAAGDVIRTQPFPLPLSLRLNEVTIPATAQRIMYRSNDAHDEPIAVTGTYFEPSQPRTGPGDRPLVTMAAGTQGQGDDCAPSKLFGELLTYHFPFDVMTEYEVLSVYLLLARGVAVVMTDYAGLGTPAVHDWMNRQSQGHAVLDAARAARKLPGTSLGAASPLAIAGYSQGGGAAASAAEMQPGYAPELDLRGSFVGAVPADLIAVLPAPASEAGMFGNGVISGPAVGLFGYILNSLAAVYPEARPEIDRITNDSGKWLIAEVATSCIPDLLLRNMFRSSREFTASGRLLSEEILDSPILRELLDRQRIGRLTPGAPVYISSAIVDDLVGYPQSRQLAQDWCDAGTTVELNKFDRIPPWFNGLGVGHVISMLPYLSAMTDWLLARFTDVPTTGNCSALPN